MVVLFSAPGTAQDNPCRLDSLAPWVLLNRDWSNEVGVTWSNDSLRDVLLGMAREDQAVRREFSARHADSAYRRQIWDTDQRLGAQLADILDRFGLPVRSMVGPAGTSAAFLIVQHNDSLHARVLSLARATVTGEVPPPSVAMLEDRVRVADGRPQRFGTQFRIGDDGLLRFAPTEDTARLDARRAMAGLPPMETYACILEEGGLRIDRSTLPPPATTG